MFVALRGPVLLIPLLALIVVLAVPNVLGLWGNADTSAVTPALANEPLDGVVTGSIEGPAVVASLTIPPVVPQGSVGVDLPVATPVGTEAFRAALTLIDDDPAAAFAAAGALPAEAERLAAQWASIYFGGGAVDYRSVLGFAAEAPVFAATPVFKTRLEQGLLRADVSSEEVIRVLGGAMPATLSAQIALALGYVENGQRQDAELIARTVWTGEFLSAGDEDRFFKKLGGLLTPEDHWARAVHLMMHDRVTAVQRLLPFLSPAQRTLADARTAVSRSAKDAKAKLDAVDETMQTHPVYLFSRAQVARRDRAWADAVDWHDKATGDLPDAAEWWYERRGLARELIELGKHALAYKVSAAYTTGPEGRVVDAQFHAGWIALAYLDDAAAALSHFEAMRGYATLPDTISQSHYWLGRAKRALGDKLGANEAFAAAARQRTVFYGLLARAELGMTGAALEEMPDEAGGAGLFEANEVVQAVRLLVGNGRPDWAEPLLGTLAASLEDPAQLALAARLAEELDDPSRAIEIAEDAGRLGIALDPLAFPSHRLPVTHVADIDHSALFAVTRQESRFQLGAVSPSGARGLMQLMPGTAKETAAKAGVDYSKDRLTSDAAYNALLGATYLRAQLSRYDGSLLLAAAAYNAGPGNANKWIAAFGDPRSADVDPVSWIERIPLTETRTYVKRVLGNYLVYRTQAGDAPLSMLDALRSIH